MFARLLAAFIIVPLVELALLLQLARHTSVFATIMLVIATGILGSILARREGLMAWFRFTSALAGGRVPSREIQDGLMIVFAAALLLTPGLLTDALGFTLLLPTGRDIVRRTLLRRLMQGFNVQVHSNSTFSQEADFSEEPLHRTPRDSAYTIDAESVQRKS